MITLLAYELKKILNRKVLWVVLALGVVLWAQMRGFGIIQERLGGSAQGEKDVIKQYEGQILTKNLKAQMQKDFDSYIVSHADHFIADPTTDDTFPGTGWSPGELATPYDGGVWVAYSNLMGEATLEDMQDSLNHAKQMLSLDKDEKGNNLTDDNRRSLQENMQVYTVMPVVHDTMGWQEFFEKPNENGIWVLATTVVALLGLFGGEASARMEAIILSARDRRRAATAKLLAAGIIAGGSVVLFFGLQFAALAFTWGLQGALLPATAMNLYDGSSLPIVFLFALSILVLMLDAVACAAIVAWASARFRQVLLALLVAGGILAGMALLWHDSGALLTQLMNLWLPTHYLLQQWIRWFVYALPANTLLENAFGLDFHMTQVPTVILHLALPLALSVVFFFLAQCAFLHRRKV